MHWMTKSARHCWMPRPKLKNRLGIVAGKTKWYNEQLVKNGVEIVKPTSELIAGLTKIGEGMIADWTKKAGADGEKLLNDYKSK